MKKLLLTVFIVLVALVGCASTDANLDISELDFREISSVEYVNSNTRELFLHTKSYKITNCYITSTETRLENDITETVVLFSSGKGNQVIDVYASDFINSSDKNLERLHLACNNEKTNGQYTIYVYGKTEYKALQGYSTKVILYNIETLPETTASSQVKNQTKVDESKTSTPTKNTLPKNNLENGSKGGMGINWDSYWEVDWIEADGSLQYYDALGCDVPLLEGVYYFSNDDKYPWIFFTIDGLESFIKEYNKNANTSLLNEVRFKLSNLSFTKLQEALISEKQFTFIQLSRMSMLDLDYIFNETSEMFKNTIFYILIVMPYNNTHQAINLLQCYVVMYMGKDMFQWLY